MRPVAWTILLSLVGAVPCGATEPASVDIDARPDGVPWSPARWDRSPRIPTAIEAAEIDGQIGVLLHLPRNDVDDVLLDGSEDGQVRLAWPAPNAELPVLPPPAPPVRSWSLSWRAGSMHLDLSVEDPRAVRIVPVAQGWHIVWRDRPREVRRGAGSLGASAWLPIDSAVSEADDALHRAVREARRGEQGIAISRLVPLVDPGRHLAVRTAALSVEADILYQAGLLLLAVEPLAWVAREAPDSGLALSALRRLRDIHRQIPGALVFAHPHLENVWRENSPEGRWAALEAARTLLRTGHPSEAADRLWIAARDPRERARARFLVHVAARLAGDTSAAETHLDALAAHPRASDAQRLLVGLSQARLAFDAGRLEEASTAYATLAGQHPEDPRIKAERIWLALRSGESPPWGAMVPFDISESGIDYAIGVGAAYHQWCHPRRAAAIASRVIEILLLDPISRRLRDEAEQLKASLWSSSRRRLMARLERYEERRADNASKTSERRSHLLALKLRISADARLGLEARARLRRDVTPPPPEPDFEGWRSGRWIDSAATALKDRCPLVASGRPMRPSKPVLPAVSLERDAPDSPSSAAPAVAK